jgi:hypothetical protein
VRVALLLLQAHSSAEDNDPRCAVATLAFGLAAQSLLTATKNQRGLGGGRHGMRAELAGERQGQSEQRVPCGPGRISQRGACGATTHAR